MDRALRLARTQRGGRAGLASPRLRRSKHFLCGGLLALAACSGSGAPEALEGAPIECALDGAGEFAKVCAAELVGGTVIFRRPDGGFRRVIADGASSRSADGADEVSVTELPDGQGHEYQIAGDRFRLPAGGAVAPDS